MIKVLIVDDDIDMLQGLANLIEWDKCGCEIIGQASNGKDALEIAKRHGPEIIITDITMPSMSGLELLKEVKGFRPDTRFIILTCHQNFSYAKEAIELEADLYLTKYMLTEEEILKAISKVKEKLEKEKVRVNTINRANWGMNLNKYAIRGKFFKDTLENKLYKSENIFSNAELLNIYLPNKPFRVLGVFVDNFKIAIGNSTIKEEDLFSFAIYNIAEEIFNEKEKEATIFSYSRDEYFIVIGESFIDSVIKQKLLNDIAEFQSNVRRILNVCTSVCISPKYDDISQIRLGVSEVCKMRESYFYKTGEIIAKEHIAYSMSDTKELYEKYMREIMMGIISFDKEAVSKSLEGVFREIEGGQYSPSNVRKLFRQLGADIQSYANKKGIVFDILDEQCDTLEGYRRIFSNIINELIQNKSSLSTNTKRKEIRKVLEYIENNLERNITCEIMAEYVNMNSSYFSRFFKNEVGISFSEYLLNMRIQRATILLYETGLTAEEVSKMVGINNVSYFYRIYKKMTGKTTREIRCENTLEKLI